MKIKHSSKLDLTISTCKDSSDIQDLSFIYEHDCENLHKVLQTRKTQSNKEKYLDKFNSNEKFLFLIILTK